MSVSVSCNEKQLASNEGLNVYNMVEEEYSLGRSVHVGT